MLAGATTSAVQSPVSVPLQISLGSHISPEPRRHTVPSSLGSSGPEQFSPSSAGSHVANPQSVSSPEQSTGVQSTQAIAGEAPANRTTIISNNPDETRSIRSRLRRNEVSRSIELSDLGSTISSLQKSDPYVLQSIRLAQRHCSLLPACQVKFGKGGKTLVTLRHVGISPRSEQWIEIIPPP